MTSQYLSTDEAAVRLGITTDELNELRESFKLRGFRDGGGWKFRTEDVEKYATIRNDASTSSQSYADDSPPEGSEPGSSAEISLDDGSGSFSAFLWDDPSTTRAPGEGSSESSVSASLSDSSSINIAGVMERAAEEQNPIHAVETDLFDDELGEIDDQGSDKLDPKQLLADDSSGSIHLVGQSGREEKKASSEPALMPEPSDEAIPSLSMDSMELPEFSLAESTDEPTLAESVDETVPLGMAAIEKPQSGIDSGLNLDGSPGSNISGGGVDSGLNLDDEGGMMLDPMSLELDDSDLLTLDDLGDASSSGSNAGVSARPLEEFSLTPDTDDDDSEDSASSSQAIPLDLPETPTATIATGTPGFPAAAPATGSVLGDDPFGSPGMPAAPMGMLATDPGGFGGISTTPTPHGGGAFSGGTMDESPFGGPSAGFATTRSIPAMDPGNQMGQPAVTATPATASYSGLQVTSLVICAMLLFLDGWLLYDLVSVLSTDHQPTAISAMLLETLSGLIK